MTRVGAQYQCLDLPVCRGVRKSRRSSGGGGGGGDASSEGQIVSRRAVEEQHAQSAATALTMAAYGVEMHARYRDDWTAPVACAPHVAALLKRVPVGSECWCHSRTHCQRTRRSQLS